MQIQKKKTKKGKTMSFLTKELLLSKRERKIKKVMLPEMGTDEYIFIRSLKSAEITGWQASMLNPKTGEPSIKLQKQSRERLVMLAACDESGNPIFGREDLEALNGLENSIIGRLTIAIQELCGIGDDDLENSEDQVKN